jgi:hypothetical protein
VGKPRLSVRPAQWEELPTIGALLAQTHPDSESSWWRDQWPRLEPMRPGFSLAHHRVGMLNGHLIAHINVRPSTLRYGGAPLKVAALGKWFCTQPEYIELGYGHAVLQDALTYATEQRAHLAMMLVEDAELQTLTQHSFHSVMPIYRASFDASELAQLRAVVSESLILRPAQLADAPYLAAIFEQQWSGRLTLARSPDLWMWRMQAAESGRRALVVAPDNGPPQGYIIGIGADRQVLTSERVEVVAITPEAGIALLAAAGEAAVQRGQERICWLLPPDDGLIALAQNYVGVTLSAEYSPFAGWRARILNGEALAKALLPELRAQLQHIAPQWNAGKFELVVDAEGVVIGLADQPDSRSRLHQSDFVQLLFGAVSPAALALRNGLSEASVQLLQAVFPQRIGAFGAWDWF